MNIFYLDADPAIAAKYHCDKHVIKMILESAQLLCTAVNVAHGTQVTPYKTTHINHPCSIWIRQNYSNWSYVWQLVFQLEREWRYRYEHNKRHKSISSLLNSDILDLAGILPDGELTTPPQCMPDEFKHQDTVQAYRNYYQHGKAHLLTYTRREVPSWLADSTI